MNIDDLFHSPSPYIAKFAEKQVYLYREDITLQDYFHALHHERLDGPQVRSSRRASANPLAEWSFRAADKAAQIFRPGRIKTDILFCPTPHFGRQTEHLLLTRTLRGLAQTGRKILCLLPAYTAYSPFRQELESTAAGCKDQITILDTGMTLNRIEARTRAVAARLRSRAAFEKVVEILEPYGMSPSEEVVADFERTALYVETWERLAHFIDFDALVTRCHWYELCSPICRTAMQRGKPTITFQQGVIGHTLDVPITASKLVAFGAPSASVLAETNRRFFDAVGAAEPPVKYFNAGSFIDTLSALPDQFHRQTVLIIDMHSVPRDFCGTEGETQALFRLAERILTARLPLRRLVIRPHPQWSSLDLDACLKLVREHRDLCELSHPIWPLEDDLRRSSIVVGIWSGVLTVASACGLPTIFLQTEQGFKTRDLACFSPAQTLLPDAALCHIGELLTDHRAYAEARGVAQRNGAEYYTDGANAPLDGAFFERLLRG